MLAGASVSGTRDYGGWLRGLRVQTHLTEPFSTDLGVEAGAAR
jgi:hypothetical protein